MVDVVHKTLPPSECHEAPQIGAATTGDAGKVVTPSSGTAGLGVLRNLTTAEVLMERYRATGVLNSTVFVETQGKEILSVGPAAGQVVNVELGNPSTALIRRVVVRRQSSGTGELIVVAPGAALIDGQTGIHLKRQYETVELVTDGVEWCVLATNVRAAGYQFVRDSQYTSGAPLAVTSGTRTKLTINNLGAGQEAYKDARYDLWDQANSRLLFTRPGDVLSLRVAVRAKMSVANGFFDLESSFPSPTTGTNVTTEVMAKGSGTENRFIREYSFFIDEFAIAQGYMEFWVTPSVNMDFYSVSLLITVNSAAILGGNE